MGSQLSLKEKRFLDEFLKSASKGKSHPNFSYLYGQLISGMGLILVAASVIITLSNFNDRTVYWVFLPGIIGGVGTILFGLVLLKFLKKAEEQKKLAVIIRKLL